MPLLIERWINDGPLSVSSCKSALQWVLQCSRGNPKNDTFEAVTVCALNEAGTDLKREKWNGKEISSYIDTLKVADREDIPSALGLCLTMYSLEEYNLHGETLYHLINQTLLHNSDNNWQLIGAFCFCLLIAIAYYHNEQYTVNHRTITCFRNMTNIDLTTYETALRQNLVVEWKGFTSTSMDDKATSIFGNVMFKIDLMGSKRPHQKSTIFKHRYANFTDISAYSQYSEEKEVLLIPPIYFKVLDIEGNEIWLDGVGFEGDNLEGPNISGKKCTIL